MPEAPTDITARLAVASEGLKALVEAVLAGAKMRRLQKVYFRTRSHTDLIASKEAEAQFDRIVADLAPRLNALLAEASSRCEACQGHECDPEGGCRYD